MLPSGTVTFLFTDIESSTRLWETHPRAMRSALAKHDALLQEAVHSAGGHIVKTTGDGLHAVFETAVDGVRAVIAGQLALAAADWDEIGSLRVRMALHTAEAEMRDGDYYGSALNRAARLMSISAGGQILLSAATAEIVRDQLPQEVVLLDLGRHRLRDLTRPERVYQLTHADLPGEFPPIKSAGAAPNNLPAQLTSFVGRSKETADLKRLLLPAPATTVGSGANAGPRLVTLTGPGGTGKTRLSLHVASALLQHFADGIFFVDLAPLTDSQLVLHTVARTLGLQVTGGREVGEVLQNYLDGREMLLLLDNFEQVIDAAPLAGELLAWTAALKIMVTSREPLHLYGEQEFRVPVLRLPAAVDTLSPAELLESESLILFVQRAQSVQASFQLTEANGPVVAEICRRLDGLPLAIELAAARLKFFGADMLLTRLESRLDTLRGGPRGTMERQRALANTIGWSYDLLQPEEQLLFQRLSLFNGGMTPMAVESVCAQGISGSTWDIMESLLNKSLLHPDRQQESELRFTMLETIREFAAAKLAEGGEAALFSSRYAAYYAELAEEAYPHLRGGPRMTNWLWLLELEYDNLAAAMNWAWEDGDRTIGLRLTGALAHFWWRMGPHSAGQQQVDKALAFLDEAAPEVQAKVLCAAGLLAFVVYDGAKGKAYYGRALAIYQALGNERDIAFTKAQMSMYGMLESAEIERALEMSRESVDVLGRSDDRVAYSQALNIYGELLRNKGDTVGARAAYEEGLAVARELGDRFREAMQIANMGLVDLYEGDVSLADIRMRESMQIAMETEIRGLISIAFDFLARTALELGYPRRAAKLVGASEASNLDLGILPQPGDLIGMDSYVQAIGEQLGEKTYESLLAEGRAMTFQEAVTFALE